MTLTLENLTKIAPGGHKDILAATVEAHNEYAVKYGIDTPLREAHFLAQLAHESAGFDTTVEYGGKDTKYAPWYGRGLIQITWEDNYKKFTAWCKANGFNEAPNFDSVEGRDKAAEFPWAYLGAIYFWSSHNINVKADADDIVGVTKIINGGRNGLESRKAFLLRAKQVLGLVAAPVTRSVTDIQNRLITLGYRITATGKMDQFTEAAVRVFQKMNGLKPDGDPGPKTQAVLFAHVNS